MTKQKQTSNNIKHFHVDIGRMEIEIRKSIEREQMTEQLGEYIVKIVNSFLYKKQMIYMYDEEALDHFRYKAYDYIIRKLLVNYDTTKRAGFAFVRQMANNAIRSAKRELHKKGINPVTAERMYDRKKKKRYSVYFMSIV